jgi:Ca2+-binding RTX toxin-like protein
LTVNGNSSADTITLLANGANSNVLLYGGPSGDTINLQTIAAGSVVKAKGGSGNDTVNVSSDAANNLGTLDGIAGALLVDTDSGNDKLVLSDHGQNGLHNSNVEVRNNRVRGFAGATNDSDVRYVFDGKLELTLIGSNSRSDKFMVRLPSKSGLTMRFDGGGGTKDCVHIEGTSGNDRVRVGSFTSTRPFRLQKIECLQMFGHDGDDMLDNHAPVSSLIDGGDGDDTLLGWSKVDVIFGGDGVDIIKGNGGNDYLFGDHEFNNRNPRVKNAEDNDNMMGGTGVDTIVAVKTDIISAGGNVGDTIIGKSKGLTSVDWLKARFLTSSSKNIDAAIDEALAQSCTK